MSSPRRPSAPAQWEEPNLRSYDLIVLSSSAGKDSAAMMHVAVEACRAAGVMDRVRVVHCDLGREDWERVPELAARHAARYELLLTVVRRESDSLLAYAERRGMWPSSQARWCTSTFKRDVCRKLMTAWTTEIRDSGITDRPVRILDVMGLRADESAARARKPSFAFNPSASNSRRRVDTWLPVHGLSLRDVQRLHEEHQLELHQAYRLGMRRLSCSFCVLAGTTDLVRAARLRPRMAHEYAGVEARTGHAFRDGQPISQIIALAAADDEAQDLTLFAGDASPATWACPTWPPLSHPIHSDEHTAHSRRAPGPARSTPPLPERRYRQRPARSRPPASGAWCRPRRAQPLLRTHSGASMPDTPLTPGPLHFGCAAADRARLDRPALARWRDSDVPPADYLSELASGQALGELAQAAIEAGAITMPTMIRAQVTWADDEDGSVIAVDLSNAAEAPHSSPLMLTNGWWPVTHFAPAGIAHEHQVDGALQGVVDFINATLDSITMPTVTGELVGDAHHLAGQSDKYGDVWVTRDGAAPFSGDEPVAVLRAEDEHALAVLIFYRDLLATDAGVPGEQLASVERQVQAFAHWRDQHAERVRKPGVPSDPPPDNDNDEPRERS